MRQFRAELAALLRPRLKPPGFNDAAFLQQFDGILDAAGVAQDAEVPSPVPPPPPAPVGPSTAVPEALDPDIAAIDVPLLLIAFPENTPQELAQWVAPIKTACQRWGIDTMREIASFLANIGVESRGLTRLEENLNYSAKRMAEVWPGRFAVNPRAALKDRQPNVLAQGLAGNPQALANHVYANRMGNGPPESGDGWRHRGFGPKMITGAENQRRLGEAVGLPLADVPAYLRTRDGGMMGAGWFWFDNGLDRLAATPGIEDDRQAINGGQIGIEDVRNRFDRLIREMLRREAAA